MKRKTGGTLFFECRADICGTGIKGEDLMKMNYSFTKDFCMKDVTFEGLSGQEFAGSLKEALGILKIENPAVGLREDLKKGRYNDEELEPVIEAVRLISSIWQDPERGSSPKGEEEMNILMLLAAAFEMISRLHAALKCVKPITPL